MKLQYSKRSFGKMEKRFEKNKSFVKKLKLLFKVKIFVLKKYLVQSLLRDRSKLSNQAIWSRDNFNVYIIGSKKHSIHTK